MPSWSTFLPSSGPVARPLRTKNRTPGNAITKTGLLPVKALTRRPQPMISKTSQCETCGRQVPRTHSLFGDLCPACVLGVGRTPGSEFAEPRDTTTWAEVFPQLEVEATLVEANGLSIYRARVLDSDAPENAILQVLNGDALAAAGGPTLLEARMHYLASQPVEQLAPVLDFGDLADAFFLITAAPDLPTLAEADEADASLPAVMIHSRRTLQAAWAEGIALAMFPQTTFFDPGSGRTIWTPTLRPDDSGDGGSDRECAPMETAPGHSLGLYTLIERAGEGGFGEVWRARQERPVERTVALKILKSGLHSKRARSRFEVEQQALAALDQSRGTRPPERCEEGAGLGGSRAIGRGPAETPRPHQPLHRLPR